MAVVFALGGGLCVKDMLSLMKNDIFWYSFEQTRQLKVNYIHIYLI